jgi:hypothetical protein
MSDFCFLVSIHILISPYEIRQICKIVSLLPSLSSQRGPRGSLSLGIFANFPSLGKQARKGFRPISASQIFLGSLGIFFWNF